MQTVDPSPAAPAVATPTLKRRLVVMLYEAFLLVAVEALAVLLFLVLTGNRQGPFWRAGLMVFLFLVAGAYFVHAWSGSGFTLAMKTWRIKLVKVGAARVPLRAALLRYLLAWGWFAPALLIGAVLGLHGVKQWSLMLGLGLLAWGLTALLDKDGQFLHDRIAGTRLIGLPKAAPKRTP